MLEIQYITQYHAPTQPAYEVVDTTTGDVVLSDQQYYPTAPSRELAETIVRAVNNQPRLIRALTQLLEDVLAGVDQGMPFEDPNHSFYESVKKAREALK